MKTKLFDFKKGDILRFTVETWGSSGNDSTTGAIEFGHDPYDGDGTWLTPSTDTTRTVLDFKCPFRINE